MEDMKSTLEEVQNSLKILEKKYPNLIKAFSGFMGAVEKEGALSQKQRN